MRMPGMTAELTLQGKRQGRYRARPVSPAGQNQVAPQEYIVYNPGGSYCDVFPLDDACAPTYNPPVPGSGGSGFPPSSGGEGPGIGGGTGPGGGKARKLPPTCKEYQDTSKEDSCYVPPNIPVLTDKCYTPIPAPGSAPQTVCPSANNGPNTYWKWTVEPGGCSAWNWLSRCSSS